MTTQRQTGHISQEVALELLEACRAIQNVLNLPLRTIEDFDGVLKTQFPMLKKAIAKAEGGSR